MSEASPAKKSSKLPWILGGIALLGLVCAGVPMMLGWGVGLFRQSVNELKRNSVNELVELGGPLNTDDWPPIEVNASEMVSAYRENTAIANNKYKDKLVQVTGTVVKIEEQRV